MHQQCNMSPGMLPHARNINHVVPGPIPLIPASLKEQPEHLISEAARWHQVVELLDAEVKRAKLDGLVLEVPFPSRVN